MKGLKVRIWMLEKELSSRDVGKAYGCSYPVISKFLAGLVTSKGLVEHFVKRGCPREYFKNGRVVE